MPAKYLHQKALGTSLRKLVKPQDYLIAAAPLDCANMVRRDLLKRAHRKPKSWHFLRIEHRTRQESIEAAQRKRLVPASLAFARAVDNVQADQ